MVDLRPHPCHLVNGVHIHAGSLLGGGRNNTVVGGQYLGRPAVIKIFPDGVGGKQGYQREVLFFQHCGSSTRKRMPRLLNFCGEHLVIIFSVLRGSQPQGYTSRELNTVVTFLESVNRKQNRDPFEMLDATEAVKCSDDFHATVVWRMETVRDQVAETSTRASFLSSIVDDIYRFVNSDDYLEDLDALGCYIDLTLKTKHGRPFLSPSDFGAHNTFRSRRRLLFFDFEYAGLDSGANLLGDLLMQPDTKWGAGSHDRFAQLFSEKLFSTTVPELGTIRRLYSLRWTLVMLRRALFTRDDQVGTVTVDEVKDYWLVRASPAFKMGVSRW